jgi:hypothetical protein
VEESLPESKAMQNRTVQDRWIQMDHLNPGKKPDQLLYPIVSYDMSHCGFGGGGLEL